MSTLAQALIAPDFFRRSRVLRVKYFEEVAMLRLLSLVSVLTLLIGAVGTPAAPTQAVPPNFSDTIVLDSSKVDYPTAIAWLPDGRMLVTQQTGGLRLVDGPTITTPLSLGGAVCTNSERGLLGVAVHPSFGLSNPYIYLYYTFNKFAQTPNQCATNNPELKVPVNRVSRFTLSGSTIAITSEVVLIDNMLSYAGNHNGGDLHFGKDGKLYVSVGDGGCDYAENSGCAGANNASRDTHMLLGKLLRINPDGSIPSDNPFQGAGTERCNVNGKASTAGVHCRETWAWGLRNPFRFATDPNAAGTRIYINDVGQGVWEEIDEGLSGADYGWNVREGHCANNSTSNCGPPPTGMTNPIFDYKHGTNAGPSPFQGCNSITGGAFVPNGLWPTAYTGTYLFSDYVCGKIFLLKDGAATEFAAGLGGSSAVHLAFGPHNGAQALYYTTYQNGGEIHRISYTGSDNRAPVAQFSASPTSGAAPLQVQFDASASSDADGDPLSYEWDFGDGATQNTGNPLISHTYSGQATRTATLIVRDDNNAASQPVTRQIFVGNTPPQVAIVTPAPDKLFAVGEALTLVGSASDAEGPVPTSAMTWTVTLHHAAHTHPFLTAGATNTLTFNAPAPEDLAAAANSYLEIQFAASDAAGQTVAITQELRPHKVDLTFATAPAGLQLSINGNAITGPDTVTSWEGYQLQVVAPAQLSQGKTWVFTQWGDGGAATRSIATPASPQTYTATFVEAQSVWLPAVRR
jgi:glucose/arabinose dehydrogenase/PKD repeat protein